jgi:PKD repeat protein
MTSQTKAVPTQSYPKPARRVVMRLPLGVAVFTALVGAASCYDGQRLTGPLTPVRVPVGHKTHYDSVAPLARKEAWRTLGSGTGSAARIGLRAGALASASEAADPGLVVTPIAFNPEQGPFATAMPECHDCTFGELDADGIPTGNGLPLGFNFTFYGNSYNEFWFSTNGFIGFRFQENGCCWGHLIPNRVEEGGYEINEIIAFAWTDLDMRFGQVTYETRGDAPNRRFILDLKDVAIADEPGKAITTQLILYEGSNAIEIHTLRLPLSEHPVTQGIENSAGTEAVFAAGRVVANFELDRDAIRFGTASSGGNQIPSVSPGGNAGGPPVDRYVGVEGQPIAFKADGSDADGDQLAYAWDFNGDGVTDADGREAAYSYPDNGKFSAKVTVSDGKGGSASGSVDVLVENANPAAVLSGPDAVDEGSPIQLSVGDIVDPSAADHVAGFHFAFDCGAGEGYGQFSPVQVASCATVDNGTRTVSVKVRDKDEGEATYTKSVMIRNVAPVVDAGQSVSVMSGHLVALSGRFSDAGVNDKMWNWSWRSPEQGVAIASKYASGGSSAEQGAVSGQYRACGAGPQTITLSVTDKDGGRGEGTVTVTVQPMSGEIRVKPSVIALNERANDEDSDSDDGDRRSDEYGRLVTVYLYSNANFDATSVDPGSIRLIGDAGKGTPLAVKKKKKGTEWEMRTANLNADRLRDVKLRFSRKALIANGDLTSSSTRLTLVGRAGTCVNLSASGSVVVRP